MERSQVFGLGAALGILVGTQQIIPTILLGLFCWGMWHMTEKVFK